jgi:hypothetical protein
MCLCVVQLCAYFCDSVFLLIQTAFINRSVDVADGLRVRINASLFSDGLNLIFYTYV